MERQSWGSRATSGARARAAADHAEAAAPAVEAVDSDGEEFADAKQAIYCSASRRRGAVAT